MEMTASRRHMTKVVLAAGGLLASATALAYGIGAVLDRPATLMSPSDYLAMKAAIEVDSNVALDKCLNLEGTAFDVCLATVRAEERTRRAMLEAQYLGTVDAAASALQVKADGAYDVAVAKCDGRESTARLECLKAAQSERIQRLAKS
jgi:hypothetical protein